MEKTTTASRQTLIQLGLGATSTAGRVLGTLALYALLSRSLGPTVFGEFAYWYSVGIVLCALSDYGFAQQILTKLATRNNDKAAFEAEVLTLSKILITGALLLGGVAFAALSDGSSNLTWIVPLLTACGAASMLEFFGYMLKARSAYSRDTWWSMWATLAGNIAAGMVGALLHSLTAACMTLLLFRSSALIGQFYSAKKVVDLSRTIFSKQRFRSVPKSLHAGAAYATDNLFVQLFSNSDVFLSKHLLDPHSSGIYLAGSRLVQATLAGPPVIASVFIPALSRRKEELKSVSRSRGLVVTSVLAAVGFLVLFFVGQYHLPLWIYGAGFVELAQLMPALGLSIAFRYFSTIPGTYLSVNNSQMRRVYVNIVSLLLALAFLVAEYYITDGELQPFHLARFLLIASIAQFAVYLIASRKLMSGTK